MPISISDIKFLYSGGVGNTNANLSLGGIPSGTVITNNTLFDNVTAVQSSSGMTDYRCIYVSNTNPTYSFYNVQIFPTYTVTGNVYVQLGFSTQNDRQNVYITNFVIFANNLTYSGSQPVASSVKAVDGGPVNQETVEIDNELTNPNGIVFYATTYTITELKPLDVVPVWIKRVVPVNTAALENDGFVLNVRGNTVLI